VEHRLVSYENPRQSGVPLGQNPGNAQGAIDRPGRDVAGNHQSWTRAFAVLQAVGRAQSALVAESPEWKKLDKTARTLTELSHAAQKSPIVMLHRMLRYHMHGLRRFDLGVRGQNFGQGGNSPIHAVAFQNSDTLALYITKPSPDAAPCFLDLEPLLSDYNQARCRVLSHAGAKVGQMGQLKTRNDAEVFDEMFLEVDLEPHEIMEFCVYFPTFT